MKKLQDVSPQDRAKLDAYFAAMAPDTLDTLMTIRDAIFAAAPGAGDAFGYSVPAVRYEGRILVYYAGWRNHCSLYPITTVIQRAFENELEAYETSKGTVQFPLGEPLPIPLIKKLVKARIAESRKGR